MRSQPILIAGIFFCFSSWCQEKPGIYNSNYASTNSIFLNPSSSVDSRTYMQANIIGFSAHAMNNLMYLPDFSLWNAMANGAGDPQQSTLKLKKFLRLTASVEAPAFVISKNTFGAGIFFRARSVGEIKRVPWQLTNLFLDLNSSPDQFPFELDVRGLRVSNMSWVEYGGNFGWMYRRRKNNLTTVGGNLKYITGLNVAYGNIIRLKGLANENEISGDLDARLRYNEPAWAAGRGVGIDLGFTYKKMLGLVDHYYAHSIRSGCKFVDYKYKIGVSLRDLGAVRFTKGTTQIYAKGSGTFRPDTNLTYEEQFNANFNSATNYNPILASLPTALSVQFDYNFENHIYLNGTVVKNMVPGRVVGVQGADMLAITPRVEFKNFEAALPLTLSHFMYPQLGFAFRVRSLVLGVDNVFPLVVAKNTYGIGLYFNLGFSIFRNKACRKPARKIDDCSPGFSLFKRNKMKQGPSRKKQRLGGKKRRVLFQNE